MKKFPFVLAALVLLASACSNTNYATDVRVIDMNPKDLLIGGNNLPPGGQYGNGAQQAYPNTDFNNDYVTKSGRVYAYGVSFNRGAKFQSPMSISDEAILYKNVDGAKYSLSTYFPALCKAPDYAIVNDYFVGDGTLVCTQITKNQAGSPNIYWIYFTYKNVGHLITGSGVQGEVSPGFMQGLAQAAMQILQKAPLSETVTFTP